MNCLQIVKEYLFDSSDVISRIEAMLGDKTESFINTVLDMVSSSGPFMETEPRSIIQSALAAASLGLSIDPDLGLVSIVPRLRKEKTVAHPEITHKGLVHLAMLTGEYLGINATQVYEDELLYWNPLRAQLFFKGGSQRYQGDRTAIGYYAYFKMKNGFEKELFLTKDDVELMNNEYPQKDKTDKNRCTNPAPIPEDPDEHGKKTVLKQLLSKYGVVNDQLQRALMFNSANLGGDSIDSEPKNTNSSIAEDAAFDKRSYKFFKASPSGGSILKAAILEVTNA
jgi:recombination protein RecT